MEAINIIFILAVSLIVVLLIFLMRHFNQRIQIEKDFQKEVSKIKKKYESTSF